MKNKTTSAGATRREFFRTVSAAVTALGVKGASAAITNTASAANSGRRPPRPACCTTAAAPNDERVPGAGDLEAREEQ